MENTRKRKRFSSGAFRRYKKRIIEKCLLIPKPNIENQNVIIDGDQTFTSNQQESISDTEDIVSDSIESDTIANDPIESDSSCDDSVDSQSNENLEPFSELLSVGAETGTDNFNKNQFLDELRYWALTNNINHTQLGSFLKLWKKSVPLPSLPIDPRTILRTPRHVEIQHNYWHYGLRNALNVLQYVRVENLPKKISLRINMDGLPISKSSSSEVWPILVDIAEIKYIRPCVVGIYCGSGKIVEIFYKMIFS